MLENRIGDILGELWAEALGSDAGHRDREAAINRAALKLQMLSTATAALRGSEDDQPAAKIRKAG